MTPRSIRNLDLHEKAETCKELASPVESPLGSVYN